MNPQDLDHPDLTAYALGELAPADAEQVRRWLAQSPEVRAEFERVQQMLGFLQDAPALPKRNLHPRQRETVLAMGQAPATVARPKNVVPFLGFRRPAGSGTGQSSLAWRTVKFAAAASLMAGAFILGQKTSSRITPFVAGHDAPGKEDSKVEVMVAKTAPAPQVPQIDETGPPAPTPEVATAPVTPPKSEVPSLAVAPNPELPPVVVVANAKPAPAPAAPDSTPAVAVVKPLATPPVPASVDGFYQPSKAPEAILELNPKGIRPLPVPHEFAGVVLASPPPLNARPAPAPPKPEAQPGLEIHSWKAEIASCPWDSSRRLMRFVAQIPVGQPGIEDFDKEYKLVAKFDPFQVQAYRLITDKHMRPSGAGTLGTRFAWYEIIPTRNFNATADKPVTIGTITIEQPRGSAHDPGPLKLVDRGLAWSDAREDFVFETAMTGWNMLLEGKPNLGGLNSKVVLDLAEKNCGEDAKGERAKFINLVRQANRAVGM